MRDDGKLGVSICGVVFARFGISMCGVLMFLPFHEVDFVAVWFSKFRDILSAYYHSRLSKLNIA